MGARSVLKIEISDLSDIVEGGQTETMAEDTQVVLAACVSILHDMYPIMYQSKWQTGNWIDSIQI